MYKIRFKTVVRFAILLSLGLMLLTGNAVAGQDHDRDGRRDRARNRRSTRSESQLRASASANVAASDSAESDNQVIQATRLIGVPIRLSDGDRLGFVEDFVVDNAGQVPFIITDLEGDNVAIPFPALSFGRISSGSLTLDIPIRMIDGMPRFSNMTQLSAPAFQDRLVSFFRDEAGLDGINRVRIAPQEIRPATAVLGTNIRTLDGRTFGSIGDFMIDRKGVIQFATTAFDGGLVPIPFSSVALGDLRSGFVTVAISSAALVGAPRLTSVTTIDPAFREQVRVFFANSQNQAGESSTASTRSSTDDRSRPSADQQAQPNRVRNEQSRESNDQQRRARNERRDQSSADRRDATSNRARSRDAAEREATRSRDDRNRTPSPAEDRRGKVTDLSPQREPQARRRDNRGQAESARQSDQSQVGSGTSKGPDTDTSPGATSAPRSAQDRQNAPGSPNGPSGKPGATESAPTSGQPSKSGSSPEHGNNAAPPKP
jgi:PRC-barrel domain